MATIDKTEHRKMGVSGVPTFPGHAFAITPSDSDDYKGGIVVYVGVGGDVAIVPFQGDGSTAVTFKNLPAGACVPVVARKVMSTNTTATNLVGVV